jgi:hypothetical protein
MDFDVPCTILKKTDEGRFESRSHEFCAVVNLRSGESRAPEGESASAAPEQALQPHLVLLLRANTISKIDDLVEVQGATFRVTHIEPVRDVVGKLDCYQIKATQVERQGGSTKEVTGA